MATYKLDILEKEKEGNLPYWLDPRQKDTETMDAIRKKIRDRWLEKQKQKRQKK